MKNSARWGPDRDNNTILIRRIRKEGFLMVDHLGDTERIAGIRSEIKSLAAQRSLTLPVSISYGFDSFPFCDDRLARRAKLRSTTGRTRMTRPSSFTLSRPGDQARSVRQTPE